MLQVLIPVCVAGIGVFGLGSVMSLAALLAELGYKPNRYAVQELKKLILCCLSLTFLSALTLGQILYHTGMV